MKNYELRGKAAYYDSVANNTPLVSAAQAKKWINELHKSGEADVLYIKTIYNNYYKQPYDGDAVPITESAFRSEWDSIKNNELSAASELSEPKESLSCDGEDDIKKFIADEIENIIARIRLKIDK